MFLSQALAHRALEFAMAGDYTTAHGMRATKPIYEKGIRIGEEPDWKERRENAALIIAYLEGKPIEKQIQAHGDFEDLQSLLEAMKQSPAARASLAYDALQNIKEGKEIPSASPEPAREDGGHPS